MRPALATAFVLLALLPAACNKKPASDQAPQAAASSGPGVPGPGYNRSPEANAKFLADYGAQKGVIKTADGLLYRVLKAGSGKTPLTTADMVSVLYKGQTIDGKVFDQTTPPNPADPNSGPRSFPAGQLIPGWVEALAHMKEGDTWELVLPPELGYGADAPPAIGANQVLVFQMTLLKVEFAKEGP